MAVERSASPGPAPALVIRTERSHRTLRAGPSYRLGRDPKSDIVLDDPRVSWLHAVLRADRDGWLIEDSGSTNGTFVGSERIERFEITGPCEIRFGEAGTGTLLACSFPVAAGGRTTVNAVPGPEHTVVVPAGPATPPPPPPAPSAPVMPPLGAEPPAAAASAAVSSLGNKTPSAVMRIPARTVRIGRAPDNDVVVSDLSVSRHHAELRRNSAGGYEIVDLSSYNGTFVNGQRITAAQVTEADVIGIGRASYRLVGFELQEYIDSGDISLDARGLTVRLPGGKVILDDVSFPLGERCLLGVIGPSGAGKSTLLGALTGMRPATEGTVLYDGRDLYANYAELRHRIGLVPQENILHTQLSARRALGYAAELRFPRDTSAAERERRIGEVLGELSLTAHADTRASSLSGGQQKRVNVALELLTKPSLLFLDEPTSGLDPGLDMSVMEMMSELAHDGRTVIVVTHSVANLNVCDRLLVLVPGGKVAYFGPPADGLKHFGKPGWAQVFRAFEAEPDRDWAGEYRRSEYHARYVAVAGQPAGPGASPARKAPPMPRSQNRLAQFATLVRRYVSVIGSDRNYVGVIALLPVILGGVVRVIPDPGGLTGTSNGNAIQVLLILIMGACLTGVANAVRELVKERAIYTRERAAGLSVGAYLGSKVAVLGVICMVQAVVLVAIGLAGRPLPPRGAVLGPLPLVELMLAIAVLAVASMTAGLLISAVVNSSDKTMPLLVVVVLVEVVLSGAVFRLNGKAGLEQFSWLSPSRWGLGATASTVNLNQVTPPPPGNTPDPLWRHSAHVWLGDMAMQVLLAAVFIALTWWRLQRTSPGRRR